MKIHRYTTNILNSHMYFLEECSHALAIDPADAGMAFSALKEHNLVLDKIMLTHEHCDHSAGAEELRWACGCPVFVSETCARGLVDMQMNHSRYFDALYMIQSRIEQLEPVSMEPFVLDVDETFIREIVFEWQGHSIYLRETPGHSPGSTCILVDGKHLFSGDTILWEEKTITRFWGGSKNNLIKQTIPWLCNLDPNIHVYPGHLKDFRLGDRLKTEII